MTTLALRAPRAPLKLPAFGRFLAALGTFLDVYAEAQQMTADAHKRFPFACW